MHTLARVAATVGVLATISSSAVGQQWRQAVTPSSPPARTGHGMAHDTARQRTLVFGGYNWTLDAYYRDLWEFDGAAWSQVATPPAMAARNRPGLCYDAQRGVSVVFGGISGGWLTPVTYHGDTWEYDGVAWQQIVGGPAPSPRFAPMAYDAQRGKVVLFGGSGGSSPYTFDDTWEYDGSGWTQRTPVHRPPAFNSAVMAYDAARGVVVLQQGLMMGSMGPMQTWEWDGVDWQQVMGSGAPEFLDPSMAYDTQRGRIVMFGSVAVGPTTAWAFDGATWHQITAASLPEGRTGMAMASDPTRGALVMFGGDRESGWYMIESNQTWQNATWAAFTSSGTACAATGPAPTLSAAGGALPRSGATMTTRVAGLGANDVPVLVLGASATTWQGTPLPLDLGLVGLPGCSLYVSLDVAMLLANQGGFADWSFVVPAGAALHGATLREQAIVFDPAFAPRAVSNAAMLVVGL